MIYSIGILCLTAACMSTASALPPCLCTREYKPVCGSDGLTYNNECMFECARTYDHDLTLVRVGPCDLPDIDPIATVCFCTFEHRPVCGSDGRTYSNRCAFNCEARTRNINLLHAGECGARSYPHCTCTREYNPVCGVDGVTYANPCMLECAGVDMARPAPCEL